MPVSRVVKEHDNSVAHKSHIMARGINVDYRPPLTMWFSECNWILFHGVI